MLRFRAVLTMGALVALSIPTSSPADDGGLKEIPQAPAVVHEPDTVLNGTGPIAAPADLTCPPANAAGCYCQDCQSNGSMMDGLFRSDHAFSDFVEPITNPILFEDPRSMTRARFVFINQNIPNDSILRGGDAQVYGLQVTVALSERLTLIANRDGYIEFQPGALPDENGWADIGTGLKYVIIRDECNRFLLSGGFLYEWTNGSGDVFQGNGDGVWNLFLTAGKGFGKNHFIGTIGWELPNSNLESESFFYSLHLDREIADGIYVLAEMTGIEYTDNGTAIPGLNVEGGDLFNLGAGNVSGNHFISGALGAAWKPNKHLSIGAAYEIPLTDREDLMDNRTTANITLFY